MIGRLQLVSLWDMLRTYAEFFAISSRRFGTFMFALEKAPKGHKLGKFAALLDKDLDALARWAALVELASLPPKIERIKAKVSPDARMAEVARDIDELCQRTEDELRSREFLYVQPRLAAYYREPLGGWTNTAEKFPSAQFDVEEASKCLALGRHTACVLHLMRVLETGLGTMAKNLGVRFENRDWGHVLNDLQGKVNALGDDADKTSDWRERQHFLSGCVADFRTFKNAWRNYAMHAHEKYGEEEAISIYDGVRRFANALAEGSNE